MRMKATHRRQDRSPVAIRATTGITTMISILTWHGTLQSSVKAAFTMDVYSHIIEGMQSDAMALLDEVLPPAVKGAGKNNDNLTSIEDIALSKN